MLLLLAGGTGGAKLARGLAQTLPAHQLTIVGNTGDDFFRWGLRICPDLDSLTYILSGNQNDDTGWGVKDDTFSCLEQLQRLGEESWFQLGDQDLATHLLRHELLSQGLGLTEVTGQLLHRFGVVTPILPMCDAYAPTFLETDQGRLHMQEYFVRERCTPKVSEVIHAKNEEICMSPELESALAQSSRIILGPSNPFISIAPILEVEGIRETMLRRQIPIIAVSPIIGGEALKGPTAQMMRQLGYSQSVLGIADFYGSLIDQIIIDPVDQHHQADLKRRGLEVRTMPTIMRTQEDEVRIAIELLERI